MLVQFSDKTERKQRHSTTDVGEGLERILNDKIEKEANLGNILKIVEQNDDFFELYLHDFVKLIEARHVKNGSVGRASEAYTTSFLKKWLKNMMQQTNWMIELPLILKLHLVLKKYLVSLDKFILPLMPVLSLNAIEPGNDICFSFKNEIEMLEKTIKVYIHSKRRHFR